MHSLLNSLPNNKFLDQTKFKTFEDVTSNVTKMVISVFDKIENIVRKGENAGNQHFLLFVNFNQKSNQSKSSSWLFEVGVMW